MVKKKSEHGPLYEHAKGELELAGVSGGKGNMDQKVYHTVLKLVDIYERAADSELLAATIGNLFSALSQGEIINNPTNDPEEWTAAPGLGEGISILNRCNAFRSKDGGVTWYREDTGASGVSKIVNEEEKYASAQETSEDIQPTEG